MKDIIVFLSEFFLFSGMNFSIYSNRRVYAMNRTFKQLNVRSY